MGWMITYDKLDSEQREFVDREIEKSGNLWIQGFAGSGKSVMLIHALRKKIKEEPDSTNCIVVFTNSLVELFKSGLEEIGLSSQVNVYTYHRFLKTNRTFDYIFCDEVQDLTKSVLAILNQRCKQLYVAGDSNQSIFDADPKTNEPTVQPEDIKSTIDARPYVLTRIYRLTRSIMKAVQSLLPAMNILQSKVDETKQDVQLRLIEAIDRDEEVEFIWDTASEQTQNREVAVVLFPQKKEVIDFAQRLLRFKNKPKWDEATNRYDNPDWRQLNNHFNKNNLNVEYIGSGAGSLQNAEKNRNLILMTYHSAKGMDFDNVYLPFMSSDLQIWSNTLFMVAMTRSKKNLYLTYSGYLHHFADSFKDQCQKKKARQTGNDTQSDNIEDFLDF